MQQLAAEAFDDQDLLCYHALVQLVTNVIKPIFSN